MLWDRLDMVFAAVIEPIAPGEMDADIRRVETCKQIRVTTENIDSKKLGSGIDACIDQIDRDDLVVWLLQQMCDHMLSDIAVRARDQDFGLRHCFPLMVGMITG